MRKTKIFFPDLKIGKIYYTVLGWRFKITAHDDEYTNVVYLDDKSTKISPNSANITDYYYWMRHIIFGKR